MPMTKILEQALREVEQLPEADQQIIADMIISFIHVDEAEEAEWDALVQTPESQRFLDEMVKELKEEEKNGRLLPFPGDK
jgi:hypothetical protein